MALANTPKNCMTIRVSCNFYLLAHCAAVQTECREAIAAAAFTTTTVVCRCSRHWWCWYRWGFRYFFSLSPFDFQLTFRLPCPLSSSRVRSHLITPDFDWIKSRNARCEVNYRNSRSKNTLLMNKMASVNVAFFSLFSRLRCRFLFVLCLYVSLAQCFFLFPLCSVRLPFIAIFRFINCVRLCFRVHFFFILHHRRWSLLLFFNVSLFPSFRLFPCHCTRDHIRKKNAETYSKWQKHFAR